MGVNINETKLKDMLFNGLPVKKWINNDVIAWIKELFLYNNGDTCADVTGGWVANSYGYKGTDSNNAKVTVTYNATDMLIKGAYGARGSLFTAKKIDMTPYNTLTVSYAKSGVNYAGQVVVTPECKDQYAVGAKAHLNTNGQDAVLDVSGLTGEYYVAFSVYYGNLRVYSALLS